jgi:hypothetical protein
MFGIQVSLAALGIPLSLSLGGLQIDLPLLIAFLILALRPLVLALSPRTCARPSTKITPSPV